MAKKHTRGQLCGFLMGLTFSLVAAIFFYQYFTMTTTLHLVEETMSDPALPFLQSLSHSTVWQCADGSWVRIYDLFSAAAAAGNSETVAACDTELDLKAEVNRQLGYLEKISNLCFEYRMADSTGAELQIAKLGDCASELAAKGKSEKSRTHASYLFPLPPENGFVGRAVLTKVKPAEATPSPTPTPTPTPTT